MTEDIFYLEIYDDEPEGFSRYFVFEKKDEEKVRAILAEAKEDYIKLNEHYEAMKEFDHNCNFKPNPDDYIKHGFFECYGMASWHSMWYDPSERITNWVIEQLKQIGKEIRPTLICGLPALGYESKRDYERIEMK